MRFQSIPSNLIQRYDVQGPRYTSYPTVPAWKKNLDALKWFSTVEHQFQQNREMSLYVHVPFCQSLCTFCGCNVKITKDRSYAERIIQGIHQEFQIYQQHLAGRPLLKELHLGGGTPTWLTGSELTNLIEPFVSEWTERAPSATVSIEVDPRVTSLDQIKTLKSLGFNRISLGVQDFNDTVMKAVNREQPYELVRDFVAMLRDAGFIHINFDLIYGLPFQTQASMSATMDRVIELKPSRIAFYSYAHVPWIRPAQKILEKDDGALPLGPTKRMLYELGRSRLEEAGFYEIGMDHFALPSDELYQALKQGGLHRNFMGYTVQKSALLIGLGPSSISDSWLAFIQNEKDVESYLKAVAAGQLKIINGHLLSEDDLERRKLILDLMCRLEGTWDHETSQLEDLEADGLIRREGKRLYISDLGRIFVRNICMRFDSHLQEGQKFSRTV